MTDYVHPRWPKRHKPDITSGEIGAKVVCTCGWWKTATSTPAAARVWLDHMRAEREAS